jgi:hypothetical protein
MSSAATSAKCPHLRSGISLLQETVARNGHDQVVDLLGADYYIAH